jgi:hypothetical protein
VPKAIGDLKICGTCRETKNISEYHKSRTGSDGLHNQCKACVSIANRKWRAANPEKKKAQNRSHNPSRDYYRYGVRKYGLTEQTYEQMLLAQCGLCAICSQPCERRLSVDHDHDTGRVRGLLCSGCNLGLGNFRDNPDFLARAIKYLGE